MSTTDIQTQIAKAEEAANKSRAKARELQGQLDQERAEARRHRDAARSVFEESRSGNYREFIRNCETKMQEFRKAVREDGDAFAAWRELLAAEETARAEAKEINAWFYARELEDWERRREALGAFWDELQAATERRAEYLDGSKHKAYWAGLKAFNRKFNNWLEQEGLTYRRADDTEGGWVTDDVIGRYPAAHRLAYGQRGPAERKADSFLIELHKVQEELAGEVAAQFVAERSAQVKQHAAGFKAASGSANGSQ